MSNEYPSNSNKSRSSDDEKIDPVVVNKVVSGKKPVGRRLRELFFAGDSRTTVQSVIADVIVPQIKDMASEALQQAVERFIFGDDRVSGRRSGYNKPGSHLGHTNYGARYSGRPSTPARREERGSIARIRRDDIEYIVLKTRSEAQEVLATLEMQLEKYGRASIADLKALIDWSAEVTDQNWGWEDLDGVRVTRDSQGYALNMPKPESLD